MGRATAQSPKAYDLQNLQGGQLAGRMSEGQILGRLTGAGIAGKLTRALARAVLSDSSFIFARTDAEAAYGLVDADMTWGFEPGDVRRYGAICDGEEDDTEAVNLAADVARSAYGTGLGQTFILFKNHAPAFVTGSLDFSTIDVFGFGQWKHIQASEEYFDVMTSTGSMRIYNLRVDGGWDGVTSGAGQSSGDLLSLTATSPAFPYDVHLGGNIFVNAKRTSILIRRGGYTSIHAHKSISCGLYALDVRGTDLAANASTTLGCTGMSVFGGCPNGPGVVLAYVARVDLGNSIIESTQGIKIEGDNRSVNIDGVYQENTSGGKFLDAVDSSGVGLNVSNCFGGNSSIEYPANWQNVSYGGANSNLSESAVPLPGRAVDIDSGELTTAVHGGVSVTVVTASLPPGTWLISATVQTADAGSSNTSDVGFVITTDSGHVGSSSGTSSTFEQGADRLQGSAAAVPSRMTGWRIYQNTTNAAVNMYIRARFNNAAGTLAYRGQLTAVKLR